LSETLSLVESNTDLALSLTSENSTSKPKKLQKRTRSRGNLRKEAKKWKYEVWAESPEGYDPVSSIKQSCVKVLSYSLLLRLMHQIDEYWNVYLAQLASVQNLEKGKGRRGSFSEAMREQFFKALGLFVRA